jgi:hypothetical protein
MKVLSRLAYITLGFTLVASGCGSDQTQIGSNHPTLTGNPNPTSTSTPTPTPTSTSTSAPPPAVPAPQLTSVTPSSGPERGGTVLTLRGSHFSNGIKVTVAGLPCGSVNLTDSKTLTCTTSPFAAGGVLGIPSSVSVKNSDGKQDILQRSFQYNPAPRISTIYPLTGPNTGGTQVEIFGTYLNSQTTITFGGTPCPVVAGSATMTSIKCIAPAMPGVTNVGIRVTNIDGQFNSLESAYTYHRVIPNITSMSPRGSLIAGGVQLILQGTNFLPNSRVSIGSLDCLNVQVHPSGTSLTCITPTSAVANEYRVIVRNPDGETSPNIIYYNYSYPPIRLTRMNPDSGSTLGGTQITIEGHGFENGARVRIGNRDCNATVLVSIGTAQTPGVIRCTTPSSVTPGLTDVSVQNPNGVVSQSLYFTYVQPQMTATQVNPNRGSKRGGAEITITGTHFPQNAPIVVTLKHGQAERNCTGIRWVNSSTIKCTTPAFPYDQTVRVGVSSPGYRDATLDNGFTYDSLAITSVAPSHGYTLGGTRLVITGKNFRPGAAITVGHALCLNSVIAVNGTQITCTTPPTARAETVNIMVRNTDGEQSHEGAFEYRYQPISVTQIQPAQGPAQGNTLVTITGSGFEPGATVIIGGARCTDVVVHTSGTSLQCRTGSRITGAVLHLYGSFYVTVSNQNGGRSDDGVAFQYQLSPATITSIQPNIGSAIGGTEITIRGTNFYEGTRVTFSDGSRHGSVLCSQVRVMSSTEIKCKTPPFRSDGPMKVSVQSPGYSIANLENGFTFDSLAIAQVLPPWITSNIPNQIQVQGKNIMPNAQVSIGNTLCTSVVVAADGRSLTCTVPATHLEGPYDVVVRNPSPLEASNQLALLLSLPQPTLTRVEPNSGSTYGGNLVTLIGTNFRPNTTVQIGSSTRDVRTCEELTFVNETRMTCRIPAHNRAEANLNAYIQNRDRTFLSMLSHAYSYVSIPPRITSLSLTQGRSLDHLIIEGEGFGPGVEVNLGPGRCRVLESNATRIACQIQNTEHVGHVNVEVRNTDGGIGTLARGFEFLPPPPAQITHIRPQTGSKNGDTLVLIRGTQFRQNAKVKIGGTPCTYAVIHPTTIVCITGPSRVGTGAPTDVEVINPHSPPIKLERAYTDRDVLALSELGYDNSYGHTYPSNEIEINHILQSIVLRVENGPALYGFYNIHEITANTRVKSPIRAFSLQAPDAVERLKQEYIASPAVAAIPYGNLIDYFDQVFPAGRMLSPDNPLFFNSTSLVDFTHTDANGMPVQLSNLGMAAANLARYGAEVAAIAQAKYGFDRLIQFANVQAGNTGWILDLRYQIKRVLVELRANPTPDKIKNAILVISSVGQHCGPGNQEGAILIARMFFNGSILHVNMNEPVTFEDHILTRLDQLRDEIFGLTAAFVGDDQTTHTKNYYRQVLHDQLKIAPGFANDPYANYANRILSNDQFLRNFFSGKVGVDGGDAEAARSHKGYTSKEVTKTLIDFLRLNAASPHYAPEIKAYFATRATLAQAQNWVRGLDDASLRAQGDILAADCNDLSTPEKRQACVTEILEGYQNQENMLKEMFVNATYFEQRGAYFYLTDAGLRELMIRLEVLVNTP